MPKQISFFNSLLNKTLRPAQPVSDKARLLYYPLWLVFAANLLAAILLFRIPGFTYTPIAIVFGFLNLMAIYALTRFYTAFLNNVKQLKKSNELQATFDHDLEIAAEKASQYAEAKSEFLAAMSHEIRTPLNAIMGMTNLIMMANPRQDQKENLEVLKFSAGNLLAIVNNVLDYSNIEAGNITFDNATLNINDLMISTCGAQQIKADEKGLKFYLYVDDFLKHHEIIGDHTRLTQVIYNLVNNAVKFTLQGTIWVNITCVEFHNNNVSVNFSVKDTGIGIKEENLGLIFDAFAQESMSAARQYAGTGLGLAIVKRLLQLKNTEINVSSMVNEGSEFSFTMDFPLPPLSSNASAESDQSQVNQFGQTRVLIAEDNEINVTLMKKLLLRWNITPTFAGNGIQAVELVKSSNFDIVLMDLQMPFQDGFQASAKIRVLEDKRKASVPIIALSASALPQIRERVYDAGMDDYLAKPFNPEQLKEKMQQLLQLA